MVWFEEFFKSLSLKSQKRVHGQAASCRSSVWFVPPDNAIVKRIFLPFKEQLLNRDQVFIMLFSVK